MYLVNDGLRRNYLFSVPVIVLALISYLPLTRAAGVVFSEVAGSLIAAGLVKGAIIGGIIEIYSMLAALLLKICFRNLWEKLSDPPVKPTSARPG